MSGTHHTPGWQHRLTQAWTQRGLLAWLLWPVSLLYRLLVALRRGLFRTGLLHTYAVPVPVIVVGNVVAGGAGKTPVVMALVAHLQRRSIAVGVISRGYGRQSSGCLEVTPGCHAQAVGDEPALIHQRTGVPVFVAAKRMEAAAALLARYPHTQVIVSDDGLQHLALQRDLEIGVFDERGVGNGFLLPAGPLREPWPRPLDLLLHTGNWPVLTALTGLEAFIGQRRLADYALRADGSRVGLADLRPSNPSAPDLPLLALAAIARPEAFFTMLRAKGLPLAQTLALPDHYDFNSWLPNDYGGYRLICTEKDAVKLWPLVPQALAVPLEFLLPDAFWQAFDALLDRLLPPSGIPPDG